MASEFPPTNIMIEKLELKLIEQAHNLWLGAEMVMTTSHAKVQMQRANRLALGYQIMALLQERNTSEGLETWLAEKAAA